MNLKHVPPSAPTAMLDRQEGNGREGRRIGRIMRKMTINNNNNNSSTGKKVKGGCINKHYGH